jgi:hypothetical protein
VQRPAVPGSCWRCARVGAVCVSPDPARATDRRSLRPAFFYSYRQKKCLRILLHGNPGRPDETRLIHNSGILSRDRSRSFCRQILMFPPLFFKSVCAPCEIPRPTDSPDARVGLQNRSAQDSNDPELSKYETNHAIFGRVRLLPNRELQTCLGKMGIRIDSATRREPRPPEKPLFSRSKLGHGIAHLPCAG